MKSILLLLTIVSFSCSQGNSGPSFKYKKPAGDGVVAKVGDVVISEKEMMETIQSDLYEAEKKIFDIKFGRIKALLLKKYMEADPAYKGNRDLFMDEVIAKKVKVTDKEIDAFAKEKKIPQNQITDQLKLKIKEYLEVEKKKDAVDIWLAEKAGKNTFEIFIQKPRRPTYEVAIGNAPTFGPDKAKVKIVEFSDFQCPYCARGAMLVKQLKEKYGDKIQFAFKQYPLPFHKDAKGAAVAALCMNEQSTDKFWKFHYKMFENQDKLQTDELKKMAKELGADEKKFNECLDKNKYLAQVEKDIKQGQSINVKSTPTFFVNGQLISGAQPIEIFSELIDEQL